jgi:hypothetical protein
MHSSRRDHTQTSRWLSMVPTILALLVLAASAEAGEPANLRLPDLGECQDLKVQRGNVLTFNAIGVGVQIYVWTGTSWSFVSPEALLFASPMDHVPVGFHFAGPTWESLSGSTVVGSTVVSCAPNPDAIPWLLVKGVSHAGHGIFQRVTYIQRLNTVGGKAPSTPGNVAGQVARVPYSAHYYFYEKSR